MKDVTFITSNQNKADQLAKWLGHSVPHQKIDVDEIQSLDPYAVIEHKVRAAYAAIGTPVLVEDVSLVFTAFNTLPGPLIKWFLQALGLEGLCRLLDSFQDRSAKATVIYGLYDGQKTQFFEASMKGSIAQHPQATGGFGFDAIFINEGYQQTRAEMDEVTYAATSYRRQAISKLKTYLNSQEMQ